MAELDKKEQKILYELEKNARAPVSAIAKSVGVSKQLASHKIKRLERAKIIEGYHAIIDTSRLGYITFRVYLKFQHLTSKKREELLMELSKMHEITILLSIDGRWDAGFAVMVRDISSFYGVWDNILKFRDFIDTYHISIYSPIYHFTRTFLSQRKEEPRVLILGGNEKIDHDELDLKILRELAPNVRKPVVEIAYKLRRSLQVIINRIRNLEKKKILQGYRPIINWDLLGYTYYKVDIDLLNRRRDDELFNFCKKHKFIFQIDKTIGGSDLEIEIYAKSKDHFKKIMQEIQDEFHSVFKNYSYFTLEKTYKETFFPL